MSMVIVALSRDGAETAFKIRADFPGADVYLNKRLIYDGYAMENKFSIKPIGSDFKSFVESIFLRYDFIIFVMAVGIVVRAIAPYIRSKKTDPGIVVVDDTGKYAVSLLSGHIGGANELAQRIATNIGAISVITTSTDRHGIMAFDTIASKLGLEIEHISDLKKISAAQIEGREVCIFCDSSIQLNIPGRFKIIRQPKSIYSMEYNFRELKADISAVDLPLDNESELSETKGIGVQDGKEEVSPDKWLDEISDSKQVNEEESHCKENGLVIFSNRMVMPEIKKGLPFIVIRPRNIWAGIGCKKGIEGEKIREALMDAFIRAGRSIKSLCGISTVDIKSREAGILETSEYFGVPLKFFNIDEINSVEEDFINSPFVKEHIGVGCVSEPCAYLGSNRGMVILPKTKYHGITIALAEMDVKLDMEMWVYANRSCRS